MRMTRARVPQITTGLQGKRIGVWLVGVRGTLASTVVVGARALARGLAGPWGLVTELPELSALSLVGLNQMVFGGWDVAPTGLVERARALALEDRALPADLVAALGDDLKAVDERIRPGFLGDGPAARSPGTGASGSRKEPLAAAVERLGDDLDHFRASHDLETVVVVNVASTEAPIVLGPEHRRLESFRRLIQQDRRNAGENGTGAPVPLPEPGSPVLGGVQHPGRGGWPGAE